MDTSSVERLQMDAALPCAVALLMNVKERLILELLSGGEMSGRELVEQSDGDLQPGTVYAWLASMKRQRLVKSREMPRSDSRIGLPQKMYSRTTQECG